MELIKLKWNMFSSQDYIILRVRYRIFASNNTV